MKKNSKSSFLWPGFIFLSFNLIFALTILGTTEDIPEKIKQGLSTGKIAYKLSEPEEIKSFFGPPQKETQSRDGGMLLLELKYPDLSIRFGKMANDKAPFTLRRMIFKGKNIDIGQGKKVVFRNNHDLKKIDRFWGLQNISLIKLDLRSESKLIRSFSYDTLTEWPQPDKLPENFDPGQLLQDGMNPGLGIRTLHEQGINGSHVGFAIIDQPLLLDHKEYSSRITHYDPTSLVGMPPQMHASPLASIAVGQNLGVAPKAALTFFAVPMWKQENAPYIRALKNILELNQKLPSEEKIRVVCISTGMFSSYPNYDEWKKIRIQAEKAGILVITCDRTRLKYGTLALIPGKDPNDPYSYKKGPYIFDDDVIRIPTTNKTIASHRDINVYTYDRQGGMSWAAPYIAGLAALAFQVDPGIEPDKIFEYLVQTANTTEAGPVVNPPGFIKKVSQNKIP